MRRGAVQKNQSVLINFYLPEAALPFIDQAVRRFDTDRSKFIRLAVREKLGRLKVATCDEHWSHAT